jgi:predicted lipid carrier protein YhbT
VSRWLSEEWFERTRAMAEDQPARPGLTARIQHEVTGGPDGDVRYYCVVVDGRLTQSALGRVDQPDLTLTTAWADAVAIQTGDLDPTVAFMQGKLKVAGSMSLMMELLPETNTAEHQELRRGIAELTDF